MLARPIAILSFAITLCVSNTGWSQAIHLHNNLPKDFASDHIKDLFDINHLFENQSVSYSDPDLALDSDDGTGDDSIELPLNSSGRYAFRLPPCQRQPHTREIVSLSFESRSPIRYGISRALMPQPGRVIAVAGCVDTNLRHAEVTIIRDFDGNSCCDAVFIELDNLPANTTLKVRRSKLLPRSPPPHQAMKASLPCAMPGQWSWTGIGAID